jgi:hypothetical protein
MSAHAIILSIMKLECCNHKVVKRQELEINNDES